MLETDCMIPVEPVQIEHPDHVTLYGVARSVDYMQRSGCGEMEIRRKLHIGQKTYRAAMFDIQKKKQLNPG